MSHISDTYSTPCFEQRRLQGRARMKWVRLLSIANQYFGYTNRDPCNARKYSIYYDLILISAFMDDKALGPI